VFASIKEFLRKSRSVGSTINNLIGYNELHYILYEMQVRQNMNTKFNIDISDMISKRQQIPNEVIVEGRKWRNRNPFQVINVVLNSNPEFVSKYGKTYGYFQHLGHSSIRGNSANVQEHIKYC